MADEAHAQVPGQSHCSCCLQAPPSGSTLLPLVIFVLALFPLYVDLEWSFFRVLAMTGAALWAGFLGAIHGRAYRAVASAGRAPRVRLYVVTGAFSLFSAILAVGAVGLTSELVWTLGDLAILGFLGSWFGYSRFGRMGVTS
jgi:hypothetical protein